MTKTLTTIPILPQQPLSLIPEQSILMCEKRFEFAQRVANMLSKSNTIPDSFKKSIPDIVIALNYADRLGIDPLQCMQKLYIVHGTPGIEAQLQIALLNKARIFEPLRYKMTGEGMKKSCTCYAKHLSTKEMYEGQAVSMQMAKDEGWSTKKGSKWQTMPELMLRYRAAAFFIRQYAPEVTLGLYTKEEVQDIHGYIEAKPNPEGVYETEFEDLAEAVNNKPTEEELEAFVNHSTPQPQPNISKEAFEHFKMTREIDPELMNKAMAEVLTHGAIVSDDDIKLACNKFDELKALEDAK